MITKKEVEEKLRQIISRGEAVRSSENMPERQKKREMKRLSVLFERLRKILNYLNCQNLDVKEEELRREKNNLEEIINTYETSSDRYNAYLSMNQGNIIGNARGAYLDKYVKPIKRQLEFIDEVLGEKSIDI